MAGSPNIAPQADVRSERRATSRGRTRSRSGAHGARDRGPRSPCGRTSDDEIAKRLVLSTRTVHAHLQSARRKTKTRSRVHLAVTALRSGLVPLHPPTEDRYVLRMGGAPVFWLAQALDWGSASPRLGRRGLGNRGRQIEWAGAVTAMDNGLRIDRLSALRRVGDEMAHVEAMSRRVSTHGKGSVWRRWWSGIADQGGTPGIGTGAPRARADVLTLGESLTFRSSTRRS